MPMEAKRMILTAHAQHLLDKNNVYNGRCGLKSTIVDSDSWLWTVVRICRHWSTIVDYGTVLWIMVQMNKPYTYTPVR